jgi:2-phosphosulfolactate phosphatase
VDLLQADSDVLVVVDVLSFATAVDIAVSRGASVYPCERHDEKTERFAALRGATLASVRGGKGFSLSPASLLEIPVDTKLVLPSPNGSVLCAQITAAPVLAGCLRNARAVAAAARSIGSRISVIPAGEKWSDGTLRFSVEDWIGAGAIIAELDGVKSPEAVAAEAAYVRVSGGNYVELLKRCQSGQELVSRGFTLDVELAAELNASNCAPIMAAGAFLAFSES